MGAWSYSYDDFNRLSGGTANSGLGLGWTYDRYGNRWAQNASCSGANCAGVTAAQPQLTFGNNNQVANWVYDADGNLLYDGRNAYNYDAEGRLIALNGEPTYVYDAEGRRVAKLSPSGAVTASYLLDLAGHQVTELNGAGTWMHSNVWAPGGKLLATYEGPGEPKPNTYHFHLTDWLGTNRMQTNAAGNSEETCTSYPFGDGLSCTGPAADATEQHFTGKERDAESGLDYFYARYYSSTLGRFMTPDWAAAPTAVPYATFGDPQTLNLYAYVNNNPNTGIDMDGHATIQGEGGGGSDQQSAEKQAAAVAAAGADDSAGDKDNSADSSSSKTGANGSSGKSKAGSAGKAPTAAKPKTGKAKHGNGKQETPQVKREDTISEAVQKFNKCLEDPSKASLASILLLLIDSSPDVPKAPEGNDADMGVSPSDGEVAPAPLVDQRLGTSPGEKAVSLSIQKQCAKENPFVFLSPSVKLDVRPGDVAK